MKWHRDEPYFNGPLAHWIRREYARVHRPNPWSPEIEAAVRERTAVPLCHNCLHPQEGHRWLCSHCGFPCGEYVVLMPYLSNFVIGEVLRQGVMGSPERRPGVQLFLVLFSLLQYTIFAPFYWFWMVRRALGKPICVERREPYPEPEHDASDLRHQSRGT